MQRVEILARVKLGVNVGVYGSRGHSRGVPAANDHRLVRAGRRGLVAFERHPDQLVTEAECVDDLGR